MIKVAIIEDDTDIRESLRILLQGTDGFTCCAAFADAEQALAAIQKTQIDVILMDINLPGKNGIECTRLIKEQYPSVQIIMQTVYDDSPSIFKSLQAGASGYMLKRTSPARILEAIEDVFRGGSPMSSQIARLVVDSFRNQKNQQNQFNLSDREKQLLDLLVKGFRYKEIAATLFISIDTVRSHIRKIYEKLQVTSRTEAVMKYTRD